MRHFIRDVECSLDEEGNYFYEDSDDLGLRLVPLEFLTSTFTDTESSDDDQTSAQWHVPYGEPPTAITISAQQEEYLEYLRMWSVEDYTNFPVAEPVVSSTMIDDAILNLCITFVCLVLMLFLM
jgi:hypothetical protein